MPINAKPEYFKSKEEYLQAVTYEDKIKALQEMLKTGPSHKGSEHLRADIKTKISKFRKLMNKEKQQKKKSSSLSIKKEGAATVCIVGTTNSGKSTLLKKLTNAKVVISPYPFATKKPTIGSLDYKGVKIQIIEIPAMVENYINTSDGPFNLSVIRMADLLILTGDINLIRKELEKEEIYKRFIIYSNQENIKDKIWNNLNLIKVYTKEPGKKPRYPPMALKKNSTIKQLAQGIHHDFIKKFKYAKIWGPSSKFPGQRQGLNHTLQDEDIVELHIK